MAVKIDWENVATKLSNWNKSIIDADLSDDYSFRCHYGVNVSICLGVVIAFYLKIYPQTVSVGQHKAFELDEVISFTVYAKITDRLIQEFKRNPVLCKVNIVKTPSVVSDGVVRTFSGNHPSIRDMSQEGIDEDIFVKLKPFLEPLPKLLSSSIREQLDKLEQQSQLVEA